MEDERLLLSEPVQAESAVAGMAAAGVDVVRIHARWIDVSPGRGAKHRPRGFDPGNHRSRRYHWETLDRAIDLTRAAGMRVMLSVTGPGAAVDEPQPAQAQPSLQAEPGAVREVRARRGDALRRPRRPLPDLERAERRGLARAAADLRRRAASAPPPRRTSTAASCAPRGRRSSARTRARRCCSASSLRSGTGRSRPAARSRRSRSCASWRAWTAATSRCAAGPCRNFSPRAPTPSAITRTASSSAPRTPTRIATRPRSATCRASSPCSTG